MCLIACSHYSPYTVIIAAVALPATLLKAADVIDNPWQIASDRSIKAGIGKAYYPKFEDCGVFKTKSTGVTSTLVLADVLEQRVQGKRPCTLVISEALYRVQCKMVLTVL